MKNFIIVDVEADGPCPGLYSMVSFGAVLLDNTLHNPKTFYGEMAPIFDRYDLEALNVIGISREQHKSYGLPELAMQEFYKWLLSIDSKATELGRMKFISDNPAFDWQWINYYFHKYLNINPFGFSARRIGDIYSGVVRNLSSTNAWKLYRKTKHDHNPVNDALGNAEALLHMLNKYGIECK